MLSRLIFFLESLFSGNLEHWNTEKFYRAHFIMVYCLCFVFSFETTFFQLILGHYNKIRPKCSYYQSYDDITLMSNVLMSIWCFIYNFRSDVRSFSRHFLPPVNSVKKLNLNWVSKTQFIVRIFSLLQSIWLWKNVYKGKRQS